MNCKFGRVGCAKGEDGGWNGYAAKTVLLAVCALMFGCSRSGDFGAFIVGEVEKLGGQSITNAVRPRLEATWTVRRDANTLRAFVTGQHFTNIEATMVSSFGTNYVVFTNSSGNPFLTWSAIDINVAILAISNATGTEVICIGKDRNHDALLHGAQTEHH